MYDADLQKVREVKKKKKADKGKEAKAKLEDAKKFMAMLNFNTIGCRVGEDSLKVRMKIAQKRRRRQIKPSRREIKR